MLQQEEEDGERKGTAMVCGASPKPGASGTPSICQGLLYVIFRSINSASQ